MFILLNMNMIFHLIKDTRCILYYLNNDKTSTHNEFDSSNIRLHQILVNSNLNQFGVKFNELHFSCILQQKTFFAHKSKFSSLIWKQMCKLDLATKAYLKLLHAIKNVGFSNKSKANFITKCNACAYASFETKTIRLQTFL